ncbi:hypothetical protein X741_32685 [Mesorhizobium sp. LNHC229A00]|nr:hypothetical protein X741_32685 [Mesorhizobium sp. LNHC229A00]
MAIGQQNQCQNGLLKLDMSELTQHDGCEPLDEFKCITRCTNRAI